MILRKSIQKNIRKTKVKLFGDMIRDYKLQESKGVLDNKGSDSNSNSQQMVNKENQNRSNFNLNDTIDKKEKDINLKYDDYELNSLEYSLALGFDNRNYFRV